MAKKRGTMCVKCGAPATTKIEESPACASCAAEAEAAANVEGQTAEEILAEAEAKLAAATAGLEDEAPAAEIAATESRRAKTARLRAEVRIQRRAEAVAAAQAKDVSPTSESEPLAADETGPEAPAESVEPTASPSPELLDLLFGGYPMAMGAPVEIVKGKAAGERGEVVKVSWHDQYARVKAESGAQMWKPWGSLRVTGPGQERPAKSGRPRSVKLVTLAQVLAFVDSASEEDMHSIYAQITGRLHPDGSETAA